MEEAADWFRRVADDYPRAREIPAKYDEWESLMWTFQQALPHAAPGQKWVAMDLIVYSITCIPGPVIH